MELTNEQFNALVDLLTRWQRERTVAIHHGYTLTRDDTITITTRTGNECIFVSDDWDMERLSIAPNGKITVDNRY